jgi:hypothetical protein
VGVEDDHLRMAVKREFFGFAGGDQLAVEGLQSRVVPDRDR